MGFRLALDCISDPGGFVILHEREDLEQVESVADAVVHVVEQVDFVLSFRSNDPYLYQRIKLTHSALLLLSKEVFNLFNVHRIWMQLHHLVEFDSVSDRMEEAVE